MKCIFSLAQDCKPPRCDKDAEYIFLGKSYCKEHLEFHAEQNEEYVEALIKSCRYVSNIPPVKFRPQSIESLEYECELLENDMNTVTHEEAYRNRIIALIVVAILLALIFFGSI